MSCEVEGIGPPFYKTEASCQLHNPASYIRGSGSIIHCMYLRLGRSQSPGLDVM
jgi:hypothetical protein